MLIVLEALALVALGVSLLNRSQETIVGAYPGGWTSYAPLSDSTYDAYDGVGALDPVLWLGAAIALAVAGVVVLALSRRRGA